MAKYYKKVEIKSENDLPENDGEYICKLKEHIVHGQQMNITKIEAWQRDIPSQLYIWLGIVDWYLQPITKEEYDKQIAFEAASNPDLIEAQTNYKLYQEKIDKLTELIGAYRELTEELCYYDHSRDENLINKLRQRITELRKQLGL